MEQLNLFTKGLKNTMDPTLFDNESWTFPTMNIRILNKNGQGFVVTFYDGATNEDTFFGEEFRLPEGFFVVGACQLNGIAYIFSWNYNYGGNSVGELGVFPSPNISGLGTAEEFVGYSQNITRKYSSLLNLKGLVSNRFRTPLFKFNGNIINCFARECYDGSANIFFVDNHNFDRVINSGFNQEGFKTTKEYTNEDFSSVIPLEMVSPEKMPIIDNVDVLSGGNMMCGMYFVFIRYVTDDFNKTKFLVQSNPIQVFTDTNSASDAEGGFFDKSTNKKIVVNFSLLNDRYKYYEIGFIRYYSDGNNPVQYNVALYNQYFLTSELQAEILDYANITPLTDGELFEGVSKEVVSKSITQNENICFKSNIKLSNKHDALLAEFSKRVLPLTYNLKVEDRRFEKLNNSDVNNNYQNLSELMSYKDYKLTYDSVGYFGGEIYPFGIVFGFNDGQESDVYPIRGIDNIDGVHIDENSFTDIDVSTVLNHANNENYNGIYRFPMRTVDGFSIYDNNKISILGLNLYFKKAVDFITDNSSEFWETIKYIRIVRGERKKNLLFQGLAMAAAYSGELFIGTNTLQCSSPRFSDSVAATYFPVPPWHNSAENAKPARTAFSNLWDEFWGQDAATIVGSDTVSKFVYLPIYRGYVPRVWKSADYTRNYVERMGLMYGKYAIYSPDVILGGNNIDLDSISNIYSIAKTINTINNTTTDNWVHRGFESALNNFQALTFPRFVFASVDDGYFRSNYGKHEADLRYVGKTDNNTSDNAITLQGSDFINDANDYSSNSGHLFYYNDGSGTYMSSSRAMHLLPYIAAVIKNKQGSDETEFNHMNLDIVNCYRNDPYSINGNSFENYYNVDTISYKEIDGVIPFVYVGGENPYLSFCDENWSKKFYRGDCFVQRTYFKQLSQKCSTIELNPGSDASAQLGCEFMNDKALDNPENDTRNLYNFGLVMSIITENAVNTAMRNDDINTGKTYYPKSKDDTAWPIKPYINAYVESLMMNHGYNKTLTEKKWVLYNRLAPYLLLRRPTRIRHSAMYSPGSMYDGYRTWNIDAYKDYDINEGEINALTSMSGTLISVQKNIASQHYSNEKQQRADINTGQMIVGIGPLLAQEVRKLDFGTIHQNSVITTPNGVYGVDLIKRAIWRISPQTTQSGSSVLGQENLCMSKQIDSWFNELVDSYNIKSDVSRLLEDKPFFGIGIVAGYDSLHEEVYFTFLKENTEQGCDPYITSSIDDLEWDDKTNYLQFQICSYNGNVYYANENNSNSNPELQGWTLIKQSYLTKVIQGSEISEGQFVYAGCEEGATGVISTMNCIYDPEGRITESELPTIQSLSELFVLIENISVNTMSIKCMCLNSRTIVFSEKTQHFMTEHDINSYLYFNIMTDSYSSSYPNTYIQSNIYRHNQGNMLEIYQRNKEACISFVVNGLSKEENSKVFNKRFESMNINSSENPFLKITYKTDTQEAFIGFLTGSYWSDPERIENKWQVPIIIADTGGQEYLEDSSLHGHYLIVTLHNTQNKYIKEILSNFNITFA